MEKDIQIQLEEHIKTLPKSVQYMLASDKIAQSIRAVGEKNQLPEDQLEVFEDEVFLFIAGVAEGEGFVRALAEEVGIVAEKIPNIIKQLDSEVFAIIKKDIPPEIIKNDGSEKSPRKTEEIPSPSSPEIVKVSPQEKLTPENAPSTPLPHQNDTPEQKKTIQEAIEAKTPTPDPYREPVE